MVPKVDPIPTELPVPKGLSRWEFPGWGKVERIDDLAERHGPIHLVHHTRLNQLQATAICGNDITSSCLYVAALCTVQAGPYAPLALAAVALTLYLFRSIYGEVGSALPLNGGAYNVLLNTTSKAKASVAACLTVLSYVATAVISANEAMHYAGNLWSGLNVFQATIVLLGLFALLNVIGMKESAGVAVGIFIFHIGTLTLLVVFAGIQVIGDSSLLFTNWGLPPPGGLVHALFFGFAAAMLGISGFESSANFIEEQKPGVFPLTLRNMWIAVAIFNPLMALLAQGLIPVDRIGTHQEDLLAEMGLMSAGPWLQQLVSLDAVLVLSGAVLTAYVGVTGLVRRMSLDQCLPQMLLKVNRWRGTNHWIISLFFVLCCSILAITTGDIAALAGVYTLSFLGVMALFAIGNMLLKVERRNLPRDERATWPAVMFGLLAVLIGLTGNLLLNPQYVEVFAIYFSVAVGFVALMFWRLDLFRAGLAVSRQAVASIRGFSQRVNSRIAAQIERINGHSVIYFSKGGDLAALNRAALYVLNNELTNRMTVVHCFTSENDIYHELADNLRIIDRIYPRLRIDLVMVKGTFSPELIEQLSVRLNVPKNYMFIGTPDDRFPHHIEDLGGVRLIM